MRPSRLLTNIGLMTSVLLTIATPAAAASMVSIGPHGTGSQLQVSGDATSNDITVTRSGTTYMVTDPAGVTPGPGCSGGGTTATCPDPSGSVVRVVVSGWEGSDTLVLSAVIPGVLNGGPQADTITGGPAADTLFGVGDADVLMGGDGSDTIRAGSGGDSLIGGAGNDRLFGDRGPDRIWARDGERDVVGGGPGRDRAAADRKDRVKNDVERIVR
jgi:Ca2+-binding RTX toxin-like protein